MRLRVRISGANRLQNRVHISGANRLQNRVRVSGANRLQNRVRISDANRVYILVMCSYFSIEENVLSIKIYSFLIQKVTLHFDVVAVLYNKGDDEHDYW